MASTGASLRLRAAALAATPAAAGYLLAAHAAVVVSGFLFWLVAGNIAGSSAVGAAAAAVSVALLASTICQLGLPQAVLRFTREVPDAEVLSGAALTLLWLLVALGALVGGAIFQTIPASAELRGWTPWAAIVLGALGVGQATLVWHVAAAVHRPSVALASSVVEAVLKVTLVLPLAAAFGADGVLLAWAGSVFFAACAGAWILLPRLARQRLRPRLPTRRALAGIGRFSVASHIGDLFLFTPTTGVLGWLIPAIVVARYGAHLGGVFYIAWAVAAGLNAIPFALATTLVARGIATGRRSGARAALHLAGLLAVPALVTALVAGPLLSLLGSEYEADGAATLRALALGALVVASNAGLAVELKLRTQTSILQLIGLAAFAPTVLAATLFPTDWGIAAIARAWVAAQSGTLVLALAAGALGAIGARAGVTAEVEGVQVGGSRL